MTSTDAAGPDGTPVTPEVTGRRTGRSLPAPVAISVSLLGGACAAAQALVNGRLGGSIGSPVTAALVSNGLATLVLLATLTLPGVRAGLRSVAAARLPWWCYLGGVLGALTVAGTALAAPVLGVALFTVVQVSGASVSGVVTDKVGLGPMGRVPVTTIRVVSAAVAVVAVSVAQFGRPIGQLAVGTLLFVLGLGLCRPLQVALNGRVTAAAANVGSASLVNAVIGTGALVVATAVFALAGSLRFDGWPSGWWLYLGGFLALVVTGANMIAVQSLGVLRTGLTALGGQITGGLMIDALVPGGPRPTLWLYCGASLTIAAALVAGAGRQTSNR